MEILNMEENLLWDILFDRSDGSMTLDEMREEIEWKIHDMFSRESTPVTHVDSVPDEEPVISPASLYMVFSSELFAKIDGMTAGDIEYEAGKYWAKRAEKKSAS